MRRPARIEIERSPGSSVRSSQSALPAASSASYQRRRPQPENRCSESGEAEGMFRLLDRCPCLNPQDEEWISHLMTDSSPAGQPSFPSQKFHVTRPRTPHVKLYLE